MYFVSPLDWPPGYSRTANPSRARFDPHLTIRAAAEQLVHELEQMEATTPIITTSIDIKPDGMPYARKPRRDEDLGVAVYFNWEGAPRVMACDAWDKVQHNIRALAHSIGAMRGLDRWGCSEILTRSFQGFAALPEPDDHWSAVLGVGRTASTDEIEAAFRRRIKQAHPDAGGSAEEAARLNQAIEQARRDISGYAD